MENQNDFTAEQAAEIEGKPLHEALGIVLGKEFPDTPAAVKAAKDTFKFVGESGEARKALQTVMETKGFKTPKEAVDFIMSSLKPAESMQVEKPALEKKPEFDSNQFVPRSEFDKSQFYGSHPELKGHEKLVETFTKANPGLSRDEVINLAEFKEAFEPIKAVRQKSVLMSESKIGVAQDKMDQAKEKMAGGSPVSIKEAEKLATDAVIEAFNI